MIKLKNISLVKEQKSIFHTFDLHIPAHERLVIQGGSGSGKTTLLRLIAGLETPDSGEIIIDGKLATIKSKLTIPPYKRGISMLFQDLALFPHLNVAQNITYALRIQKVSKETQEKVLKEMLLLVGLSGYEKRDISTLSGGEAQRIALARALATKPKIILMDEPLSSLDEARNKILRKEIVRLQETLKFTLVYVTHNKEEAQEIGINFINL